MKNKNGIIYAAINKENGKAYIGQTIHTLDKRKNGHRTDSLRGNSKFNRAIRKYGVSGFEWEILHNNVPGQNLNDVEKLEISLHNSYKNGYNSTIGGDANPMKGKKHTPEALEKISKSLTGRKHSKETSEKKRKAMLGKRLSSEARAKISKNHADVSGKNNPMYGVNLYDHWREKFGNEVANEKIKNHKKSRSAAMIGKLTGENGPGAKLTQIEVNHMRYLYENEGHGLKQLSEQFNTCKSNVCMIINYKTWKIKDV